MTRWAAPAIGVLASKTIHNETVVAVVMIVLVALLVYHMASSAEE